jgi:hypothetical protein
MSKQMHPRACAYYPLAGLLLLASVAQVQATCFCLQDEHENIYKECETFQKVTDPAPTYRCRFPGRGLQKIPDDVQMQRIEAGERGCSPCRHAEPNKPDVSRGG